MPECRGVESRWGPVTFGQPFNIRKTPWFQSDRDVQYPEWFPDSGGLRTPGRVSCEWRRAVLASEKWRMTVCFDVSCVCPTFEKSDCNVWTGQVEVVLGSEEWVTFGPLFSFVLKDCPAVTPSTPGNSCPMKPPYYFDYR